jgi:hypothetical protein
MSPLVQCSARSCAIGCLDLYVQLSGRFVDSCGSEVFCVGDATGFYLEFEAHLCLPGQLERFYQKF